MDYMKNNKYLLICILGCALIAFTANVQANYKLGRDYGSLSKPLPIKQDGVVDVIEIFWYGCGHCFNLAPVVSNWAKQKDWDIETKTGHGKTQKLLSTHCIKILYIM